MLVRIKERLTTLGGAQRSSETISGLAPYGWYGQITTQGITVVLPARNEQDVIEETVSRCVAVLELIAPDYEIIIVDDGSTDRTPELADALCAASPRVRVVHNRPGRGYGGALMSGFAQATKPLSFFMDSDGQFDIADLSRLLTLRNAGYRVVLGYRRHRQDPFIRLVNAFGWNVLVSTLYGLRVRDVDCAFKLIDTDLIRAAAVTADGAMVNTELLVKLARLGVPFVEVPVHHYPRRHGSASGANLRVIAHAFRELIGLNSKLHTWQSTLPAALVAATAARPQKG